jgi:hypothetical protein
MEAIYPPHLPHPYARQPTNTTQSIPTIDSSAVTARIRFPAYAKRDASVQLIQPDVLESTPSLQARVPHQLVDFEPELLHVFRDVTRHSPHSLLLFLLDHHRPHAFIHTWTHHYMFLHHHMQSTQITLIYQLETDKVNKRTTPPSIADSLELPRPACFCSHAMPPSSPGSTSIFAPSQNPATTTTFVNPTSLHA